VDMGHENDHVGFLCAIEYMKYLESRIQALEAAKTN
jgi:hypothetical protein